MCVHENACRSDIMNGEAIPLCSVGANVPTRLTAAETRAVIASRVCLCPMNSAISTNTIYEQVRKVRLTEEEIVSPDGSNGGISLWYLLYKQIIHIAISGTCAESYLCRNLLESRSRHRRFADHGKTLQHRRTIKTCSRTYMKVTYQRESDEESFSRWTIGASRARRWAREPEEGILVKGSALTNFFFFKI